MASTPAGIVRSVWLYKLRVSLWLLLVKAPWWSVVGALRVVGGSYAIAFVYVRRLWQGTE